MAIVGPTGAGKSTLARLLIGLYQPQTGVIRFGGQSVDELGVVNLRRRIGVVLQEPFLLSGTIRENIALQQPDMALEDVAGAARLAAIYNEIERLPMGYETRVGEGGSGLSGGQRQRIALARALATRPAILILDEATSHLDIETERTIQRNLDGLGITRLNHCSPTEFCTQRRLGSGAERRADYGVGFPGSVGSTERVFSPPVAGAGGWIRVIDKCD